MTENGGVMTGSGFAAATGKYRPYQPLRLSDRTWPDRQLTAPPVWSSVDLRDGNQALLDPMDVAAKRRFFDLLVRIGFTEIEIGFPTSCQADWDFVRSLSGSGRMPDHLRLQVMSPARPELVERTAESLRGLPRAVLQVFNPTSPAQRRVVFRADRERIKALALTGADAAMRARDMLTGTHLSLQYAPESFTQTEPEFALEVCNAVLERWRPGPDDDVRINLPATVEAFPPAEFGDRIEWMHRHLAYRDVVMLSVHPHNDRGTGVAAAETAVLAGAQRVEGTLFGNGERSGNVCLITLAMNLFSQGVDPGLDLGDLDEVRRVVEDCNQMAVPPRHPWGGDLVYTSFAGSHQDAISKGLRERELDPRRPWDVPYLAIDPRDVGRDYQALIRVNNQSGKGGIAHLMRSRHGLELPHRLQIDFSAAVQRHLDRTGGEVSAPMLWQLFAEQYLAVPGGPAPVAAVPSDATPDMILAALTGSDIDPPVCLELEVQPVSATDSHRAGLCCLAYVAGPWGGGAWGGAIEDSRDSAVAAALLAGLRRVPRTTARAA
ncbi:2-isopropylmalate synthase [Actinoplanes philippinensis]|uniref:2-isopropylmalate synthase n=1 Tax=Actinoplanes philippinensis TaxID=35752 RepID=UPI00340406E7